MQKQKVAKTLIRILFFCLDTSATLSPQYDEVVAWICASFRHCEKIRRIFVAKQAKRSFFSNPFLDSWIAL